MRFLLCDPMWQVTPPINSCTGPLTFLAHDSIYAIAHCMLSPVCLSVHLSVTRVDQSKTVEDRIMQVHHTVAP